MILPLPQLDLLSTQIWSGGEKSLVRKELPVLFRTLWQGAQKFLADKNSADRSSKENSELSLSRLRWGPFLWREGRELMSFRVAVDLSQLSASGLRQVQFHCRLHQRPNPKNKLPVRSDAFLEALRQTLRLGLSPRADFRDSEFFRFYDLEGFEFFSKFPLVQRQIFLPADSRDR